jgi:hypothetical protein
MIYSISALITGIGKELTCIGEKINHDRIKNNLG